jgi:diaminopimelate decarboxylase
MDDVSNARHTQDCDQSWDLRKLSHIAGSTPFFAYSREAIKSRVASLRAIFGQRVSISYSVKANPLQALVDAMAGWVDGLDVASGRELVTALNSGVAAECIHFAGPGKTCAEISQAVAAGVVISVESVNEYSRIVEAAGALGRSASILLRINPDFRLQGAGLKMGGGPSPFGMAVGDAILLSRSREHEAVRLLGYHVFWGSQSLSAQSIAQAQASTIALIDRIIGQTGFEPTIVNLGGGFGIPYGADEQPLDVETIATGMDSWLPGFRSRHPRTQLVLELGRFLVGESGIYVCRVIDRKQSEGRTILVLDGGMHHNQAATGNFGQFRRRNRPIFVDVSNSVMPLEEVSIVGSLCTPIDQFSSGCLLPELRPGDLLAIGVSGAYGASASPNNFLSKSTATELLV